jgi:uncharacterized protein
MGNMREIRVRGTKVGFTEPDWVVIQMELVSEHKDYHAVIQDLNQRYQLLLDELMRLGFKQEEIKTSSIQVNTVYDYRDNQKYFVGYRANQNLEIDFPLASNRLGEVMLGLSQSQAKPEYHLQFTLKDEEAFHHRILSQAVEEATQNALVIANQLGVRLGDILEVVYEGNQAISYRSFVSSESQTITPKDIERRESVLVTWEIRNLV